MHIEISKHEPQLVINCLFKPDATFNITLGKSKSILDDTDQLYIDNAGVVLLQHGKIIDSLIWQGENYTSSVQGNVGETYKLQIEHQNGLLEASDLILVNPKLIMFFIRILFMWAIRVIKQGIFRNYLFR